jgi:hypothetical protein
MRPSCKRGRVARHAEAGGAASCAPSPGAGWRQRGPASPKRRAAGTWRVARRFRGARRELNPFIERADSGVGSLCECTWVTSIAEVEEWHLAGSAKGGRETYRGRAASRGSRPSPDEARKLGPHERVIEARVSCGFPYHTSRFDVRCRSETDDPRTAKSSSTEGTRAEVIAGAKPIRDRLRPGAPGTGKAEGAAFNARDATARVRSTGDSVAPPADGRRECVASPPRFAGRMPPEALMSKLRGRKTLASSGGIKRCANGAPLVRSRQSAVMPHAAASGCGGWIGRKGRERSD